MDNEKLENSACGDNCGCDCGGNEHEHEHAHAHGHDGCDCGCGDEEAMIVDLENENGEIVPCEVVDEFTYNEQPYVLVQNPEDGSMYLFKVVGEGEEGELIVPDDDEFKQASAYYEQLMEEEENEEE